MQTIWMYGTGIRFRMAYDELKRCHTDSRANKEYLKILQLAAMENETAVDDALRLILNKGMTMSADTVEELLFSTRKTAPATDVEIAPVALDVYDSLLDGVQVMP